MRKGSLPAADDKQMFPLLSPVEYSSQKRPAPSRFIRWTASKRLTEENVKDEIARLIFRQKMEKKIKELNASVKSDFDDKYFGPSRFAGGTAFKPEVTFSGEVIQRLSRENHAKLLIVGQLRALADESWWCVTITCLIEQIIKKDHPQKRVFHRARWQQNPQF